MIPRLMQTEEVIDRALEAYTQTISGDIQTLALLLGIAILLFIVLALAVTYVMVRMVRNAGEDQKGSNTAITALAQTVSNSQAQTGLLTEQLGYLRGIKDALSNDLPGKLAAQIKAPLSEFRSSVGDLISHIQSLENRFESQSSAIEEQIRKSLDQFRGKEAMQIVQALGEYHKEVNEAQSSIAVKLDMIIELLVNQQEGKDDERYSVSDNVDSVRHLKPGDGRDGTGDDDTRDGLG